LLPAELGSDPRVLDGFPRGLRGHVAHIHPRPRQPARPSSAELAEDDSVGDLERPGATRYRIGREGLNS